MNQLEFAAWLGGRIKKHRIQAGLTQETLAEKSSLHNTYIGLVERGKRQITAWSLQKICLALEVKIEVILQEEDKS